MFNLIPWWLRYGATAGAAFALAWWIQGLRWDASLLEQAVAVVDATHAGWTRAAERWATQDRDRLAIDVTNELDLAAFRGAVDQVQESIDHAELVTPDQVAAVCPDPRGPEWLRLYRAAAAGSAEGPAGGDANRVSAGPP